MKDRPPPSSYGSVYVPPHHRLRSVITSSASPNLPSAPVDSKTANNQKKFANPEPSNPYPYLPYQQLQQLQQKKNSQFDSAVHGDLSSEEGSNCEIEQPSNPGASTSENIDGWKWKLNYAFTQQG
ncbi:hypothetical protein F0562_032558 [Nyssa sinensis]|uniref:Uncharacterized protein n=1 Tax=Nyssa sinensis TaxID=561372 RepID=A0A5J5ARY5_9ASTE|nr:hypothetical protein F0562_032558 [Nyssa sinensis]